MMKVLCFAFLIAASAGYVFSQTKTNDQIEKQIKDLRVEKAFQLSYDDSDKTSKILVIGDDFGRDQDERAGVQLFNFGMAFFYSGKILSTAPEEINLTFLVNAKEPKFAEAHGLKVLVGGETIDFGDARYVAKPEKNMEYLNFKIARANVVKIADAKDARLKVGNYDFQFTAGQIKLFAAFAKISDPTIR